MIINVDAFKIILLILIGALRAMPGIFDGFLLFVGSVVEWLKHRTDDQHDLGSKPTCAILLCPWERHFTALSPAWWS